MKLVGSVISKSRKGRFRAGKHLPNVVEIASAEWRAWIIILGDY
jgi:hypothetical protein